MISWRVIDGRRDLRPWGVGRMRKLYMAIALRDLRIAFIQQHVRCSDRLHLPWQMLDIPHVYAHPYLI
jgi:hypothetical protein